MVYLGPSKGCRVCRTRRVKCDQARPACGNCITRKQACPGYGDTVDLMFRNNSSTIVKKNTQSVVGNQISLETLVPNTTYEFSSSFTEKAITCWRQQDVVSICGQLPDDFENVAICFFFENFATHPRDDGATAGFLEYLSGFYARAPSDSPLSLATRAISVSLGNAWSSKPVNSGIAQTYYAEAVARTNEALANPLESKSDEILMTVLVMEFYDAMSRRLLRQDASDIHQNGAAALVRHRGSHNFDTNLSKRLLLAVRSRTVQVALTRKHGIVLDARVWGDGNNMPSDPATQLDVMAANLCTLRGRIHQLRTRLSDDHIIYIEDQNVLNQVQEIHKDAVDLNAQLVLWAKSLPRFWYPISVPKDFIHPSIVSAGFYGKACDVYDCFRVAAVWNHYRNVRISVLQILEKYKVYALSSANGLTLLPTSYATTEIQMIIDDVCASVPFHLGNVIEPLSPYTIKKDVMYPKVRRELSTPMTSSHSDHDFNNTKHSHAQMKGGWFLITILLKVSKISQPDEDSFVAFNVQGEQGDWVLSQIERIGRVYNIEMPLW